MRWTNDDFEEPNACILWACDAFTHYRNRSMCPSRIDPWTIIKFSCWWTFKPSFELAKGGRSKRITLVHVGERWLRRGENWQSKIGLTWRINSYVCKQQKDTFITPKDTSHSTSPLEVSCLRSHFQGRNIISFHVTPRDWRRIEEDDEDERWIAHISFSMHQEDTIACW